MRRSVFGATFVLLAVVASSCADASDPAPSTPVAEAERPTIGPTSTPPSSPVATAPVAATAPQSTPAAASPTPAPTRGPEPTPAGVIETGQLTLEATSGSGTATVRLTPSEVSPLAALIRIDADEPVAARISARADEHLVESPWTVRTSPDHELPLVGLRADRRYAVTVVTRNAAGELAEFAGEFETGSLPPSVAALRADPLPAQSQAGYTILDLDPVAAVVTGEPNPVVALDAEGEVVWFHESTSALIGLERTAAGTLLAQSRGVGVREFTIDGRPVRAYAVAGDADGVDDGSLVVPVAAPWIELGSPHHDLHQMSDGTLLVLSSTVHAVSEEQRAAIGCEDDPFDWGVISDVVVHLDRDGTVLRTWDLWDVLDFDARPGRWLCDWRNPNSTETERDWTHANSVTFDPERNAIIVSVRHTDQIVALDFGPELGPQTGLRWVLGANGTIPYDGSSFHHTHGVTVVEGGDLVFFDNGNFRPVDEGGSPYSRAVRVRVDDRSGDPGTWRAEQVWEHRIDDPVAGGFGYSPFLGDAEPLGDGNVLVTHGGMSRPYLHASIVEVIPDGSAGGEVVWRLDLGEQLFPRSVYRAARWDSLFFGALWEAE